MNPEFLCHPKYSRIFDIIPWIFVGGVGVGVVVIVMLLLLLSLTWVSRKNA